MALLAGIDEAGYGPTLGPLIVSGVTVRVPDEQLHPCLWNTLRQSCAAKVERRSTRLAVADSKVLFKNRSNLSLLERTALVMYAVAGHNPRSWRDLLETFSPNSLPFLVAYPWYADRDVELPLAEYVGDVATRANAVRCDMKSAGIGPLTIIGELLLAGQYNDLVKKTDNKSVALLGLVMRLVDRMIRSTPERRIRICVDRLGGRQHYREALATSFPDRALQILQESPERSAYRLTRSDVVCDVEFLARGEQHEFPIALASIISKYVREIHMHMLNAFWCAKLPGLKPTAGYYNDALRWLGELTDAFGPQEVDCPILIRVR